MAAQVTDLDGDYHVLLEPPWGHAGLFLTFCLAWLSVCAAFSWGVCLAVFRHFLFRCSEDSAIISGVCSSPPSLIWGQEQLQRTPQSPLSSYVAEARSGIKGICLLVSVLSHAPEVGLPRRVKSNTEKIKFLHWTSAQGTRRVQQALKKREVGEAIPFLYWTLPCQMRLKSSCLLTSHMARHPVTSYLFLTRCLPRAKWHDVRHQDLPTNPTHSALCGDPSQ